MELLQDHSFMDLRLQDSREEQEDFEFQFEHLNEHFQEMTWHEIEDGWDRVVKEGTVSHLHQLVLSGFPFEVGTTSVYISVIRHNKPMMMLYLKNRIRLPFCERGMFEILALDRLDFLKLWISEIYQKISLKEYYEDLIQYAVSRNHGETKCSLFLKNFLHENETKKTIQHIQEQEMEEEMDETLQNICECPEETKETKKLPPTLPCCGKAGPADEFSFEIGPSEEENEESEEEQSEEYEIDSLE